MPGLLMGLRNDGGLMGLHLVVAAPGPVLVLQDSQDSSAGGVPVAAQSGIRRGRAFSCEPATARCASRPGVGLRALTRNIFDCQETLSRIALSRNRGRDSGGIGTPCRSRHGTRRSRTRRSEQSGAGQLAPSQNQEIRKAHHRFRGQARSPCWASQWNALQTT